VPSADEAVDRLLAAAELLLPSGVSCVLEYLVRAHRPRDLERILAVADCVVVMTQCADPMSRVRERNGSDLLIANRTVLDAGGYASVEAHTDAVVDRMTEVALAMRKDFPVPILDVDTTEGYRRAIDDVVRFVTTPTAVSRHSES
jgi:hypothetical protein